MTKRELRFLILLFVLILGFLSYMFVFKKQFNKIDDLKVQIAAEEVTISEYEKAGVRIKALNKSIEAIEAVLNASYHDYLSDIRQEEIILLLNEILM